MTISRQDIVYLDSNAIIAIVERSGPFNATQQAFLLALNDGLIRTCTGEIALTECLVRPIREGDEALVRTFTGFLAGSSRLPIVALDRWVFLRAAELRAHRRLSLPDALHVACALFAGCTVFVSADQRIRLPAGLRRVAFDDIEFSPGDRP